MEMHIEIHTLYSVPNIIKAIKWAGHVACMGRDEKYIHNFSQKSKRNETTPET
jgi:hypothetical protein